MIYVLLCSSHNIYIYIYIYICLYFLLEHGVYELTLYSIITVQLIDRNHCFKSGNMPKTEGGLFIFSL